MKLGSIELIKKHKKVILYLMGVFLLSTGISYAYFAVTINSNGNGGGVTTKTDKPVTSRVEAIANIEFSLNDILPGHKELASVKVIGTGNNDIVYYNLIYTGINTFTTNINYKVYKTTTNIDASYTCEQKSGIVGVNKTVYEECSGNNIGSLGSVVASGTINKGTSDSKQVLLNDQLIVTSPSGTEEYYYIEIEYPNLNTSQNDDITSTFKGNINIEESTTKYIKPEIAYTITSNEGSNGWYTSVNIGGSISGTGKTFSAKYCFGESECEPSSELTLSNNTFNVSIPSNTNGEMLCITVEDENNQKVKSCTDKYKVDNEAPTNNSVQINSNETFTTSTGVTLTLASTGASEMCISNTTSCTDWESYATSKSWILTDGDEVKTVYVWFKDIAGNTTSTYVSDTITLDTTPPTVSIASTSRTSSSITINVTGVEAIKYYYKIGNGNYEESTSTSKTFSGLSSGTSYTVSVYGVDEAGNQSAVASQSITTKTGNTMSEILAGYTQSTRTDFSTVLTSASTGIVYSAEDDLGTSLYFAGAPTDNWVYFGNFYWRIIRMNGDGSTRLIYAGTSTTTTGTDDQLSSTSAFNSSKNDNAYVGYMYGATGASSYADTHANINNSTIKGALDTWYGTYLNKAGVVEYIDGNAGFCNDRSGTTGYGTSSTYYATSSRFQTNTAPSLKCPNKSTDLFTTNGSNQGNKKLSYPIGLISADEAVYAGGILNISNNGYYLCTGERYWTMSPYRFDTTGSARVFYVYADGSLLNGGSVSGTYGVRPVINIKSDTTFLGSGTSSSPFTPISY